MGTPAVADKEAAYFHSGDHNDAAVPPNKSPVFVDNTSLTSISSITSGRIHIIPKGGLLASGFTLASATLGAGILALPEAMKHAGWAVGSLYIVFCGACCVFTLHLLVRAAERVGLESWEGVSRSTLGPWAEYLVMFFVAALCWGASIGYVVVAGDVSDPFRDFESTPEVLRGDKGRALCQSAFWLLFMLPLSLPKEINAVRYASVVGNLASVYTTGLIVYHAAANGPAPSTSVVIHNMTTNTSAVTPVAIVVESPRVIVAAVNSIKTIFSISIILFGYGCQANVFEVYHEMHRKSVFRLTLSSGLSMAMCSALYIAAGVAGYYEFGNNVESNILKNYGSEASSSAGVTLAYVAVAITVTMAFPVCIFPCRDAVIYGVLKLTIDTVPRWKRMLISFIFAVTSFAAGIAVKNLADVLGLVGALCMSFIGFLFPALFVIQGPNGWTRAEVGFPQWLGSRMLLVVGAIVGIGGTIVSVYQFVDP